MAVALPPSGPMMGMGMPIDRAHFGFRKNEEQPGKQHFINKFNYIKHFFGDKYQKFHNKLHSHRIEYDHSDSEYGHSGHESSKGQSAALSALTLLAFLFFLNILQSCLRDQMIQTTITQGQATGTRREVRNQVMRSGVKGETDDFDETYEEYSAEDPISVKLPVATQATHLSRTSSALQVAQHSEEIEEDEEDAFEDTEIEMPIRKMQRITVIERPKRRTAGP